MKFGILIDMLKLVWSILFKGYQHSRVIWAVGGNFLATNFARIACFSSKPALIQRSKWVEPFWLLLVSSPPPLNAKTSQTIASCYLSGSAIVVFAPPGGLNQCSMVFLRGSINSCQINQSRSILKAGFSNLHW